ncbi:CYTH and CHAD domain-containing protein [Streptomyces parvulus]|uniref:CYTH and CHAD domain-containing protein n=1 Tax=Streptomyces parvulus TaxID=146923 RepID=UPI001E3AEC5B|nr:CYTH and CHAD domain-containing protein [Streptomyces parvulus]MCC9156163.1 CYTH and CHAD domain-containing protein [Streptomyces parvulus]MCE7689525.1 CYTH and CHAD domain-containing protein [Streptomyces parvulus]
MTQSKRETERKYEPATRGVGGLPDLTGTGPVASVTEAASEKLDAVYHDTADLRLAGASVTLRRRTGGADAGWHLKLPLTGDTREEVRAPLSDEVPEALRALVLSRIRGARLRPVVRIRSRRVVRHLRDARGAVLAELSLDDVRADSLLTGGGRAEWSELEVELADGDGPDGQAAGTELLDRVEKKLRKKGVVRSDSPSKLSRALRDTGSGAAREVPSPAEVVHASPGSYVLGYLREQVEALVALDPAVRRDLPDAVHRMRVTCRRLRSCLRSYRSVLDRRTTDPLRAELKWLAGELGVARDQEVLRERIGGALDELPEDLVLGPVAARLRVWDVSRGGDALTRTREALDTPRYLRLLDALDALLREPPLRARASGKPARTMAAAVLKEYGRLAGRMEHAFEQEAGPARATALHEARKAAKKVRYAAEVARPALGKPVGRLGKRAKKVQKVLGDHQDAVVAQEALRALAVKAHGAGESAFTWGLLHGRERAAAEARQRELPEVWRAASDPSLRAPLEH